MRRPLILLTNDDGIDSPGLLAVINAVADLGDLLIVAPATQQTGMGRSTPLITGGPVVQSQVLAGGQEVPTYAVPGSPAQAVTYAALVLARARRLALAISGINHGENLGTATTGSGTVGAALEAASYGIPALAVSREVEKAYHYDHGAEIDWSVAAHATRHFAQVVLARRLPFDVDVLKIDVPADATLGTPWRLTRQSRQSYFENLYEGTEDLPPLGNIDYRMSVDDATLEPDSDVKAFVKDRLISVTPLSIDLTSRTDFGSLEKLLRRPKPGE